MKVTKLQIQDFSILQKRTVDSKSRKKIRGHNWRRKNKFRNGVLPSQLQFAIMHLYGCLKKKKVMPMILAWPKIHVF